MFGACNSSDIPRFECERVNLRKRLGLGPHLRLPPKVEQPQRTAAKRAAIGAVIRRGQRQERAG